MISYSANGVEYSVSGTAEVTEFTLFNSGDGKAIYFLVMKGLTTSPEMNSSNNRSFSATVKTTQNGSTVNYTVSQDQYHSDGIFLPVFQDTHFRADPGTDVTFKLTKESGFASGYDVSLKVSAL